MKIAVIGRGRVGGGLAGRWRAAGHEVAEIGRDGGDVAVVAVVVVSVPAAVITAALQGVTGLAGQVTVDTCNAFHGARDESFPSLAHQIKAIVGGPTAKAFSTNFASAYPVLDDLPCRPADLVAADPGAREVTERLVRDAGFDPVFVGDLDAAARPIEESTALTRAICAQVGPYFYRIDPVTPITDMAPSSTNAGPGQMEVR